MKAMESVRQRIEGVKRRFNRGGGKAVLSIKGRQGSKTASALRAAAALSHSPVQQRKADADQRKSAQKQRGDDDDEQRTMRAR
jgi:hypothetical protein